MKKPYVGCMVMKVGWQINGSRDQLLGTVLDYGGGPGGHYCTVAWYKENGIDIDPAIHYIHLSGWMENLKHELNKNKPR